MGFILEDRTPDGRPNGWYGGRNKKYHDLFNLTVKKELAYIFKNESDAKKKADFLNEGDWNFAVVPI